MEKSNFLTETRIFLQEFRNWKYMPMSELWKESIVLTELQNLLWKMLWISCGKQKFENADDIREF